MKYTTPTISIFLMVILAISAYFANVWFESEFGSTEEVVIPHQIVSGPDTSGIDGKPILTPMETNNYNDDTTKQLTQPTTIPTPTPEDYVILPTVTPSQQAASTVITFMYDKAPADPSSNPNSKAVYCVNGNIDDIHAIENSAQTDLLHINNTLDSCRTQVEEEANSCIESCGANFTCFEACGVAGGEKETVCESAYHVDRDPIVDSYLQQVRSMCTIL